MQLSSRTKDFIAFVITITGVVVFTFAYVHARDYVSSDDLTADNPPAVSASAYTPDEQASDLNNDNSGSGAIPLPSFLSSLFSTAPKSTNTSAASKKPSVSPTYPSRLKIPSINVDAHVQNVGITAKGSMAVPTNFTDVGWFRNGVVPGAVGTAVIDGHLNDGLGLDGVFGHLSDLNIGDEIDVVSVGGQTLHFKVTNTTEYAIDDPTAAGKIFAASSVPTIRLITCDGDWLSDQKVYNKRFVVTAELSN